MTSSPARPAPSHKPGRRLPIAVAVAAALTVSLAVAASATSPQTATAGAGTRAGKVTTEFKLNFEQGETLKPNTRVHDASGHKHNGTVLVSGAGHLRRVSGYNHKGTSAKFPRAGHGHALIEIADARYLDPGRHPFRFGASVKVTGAQTKPLKDPNLVQKGLLHEKPGRFKLELVGSLPRCIVSGSTGQVTAATKTRASRVNDGVWHKVKCVRDGVNVTVTIDGVAVPQTMTSTTGHIGRVANAKPIRIGGKALARAASNDQYHGRIDNAFLKIDRR